MTKVSFLIFISILLIQSSFGQVPSPPPLLEGWQRVYIKNVGSFDLPSTLEIQKGKYREFVDEFKKIKGFDASQITAQQKGLNKLGEEGFEKYARVMLETTFGTTDDFENLNFYISEYAQPDIDELNTLYKQQFEQNFYRIGIKLIEWYPLKLEKINGMSCIHISYKRQIQGQPLILVNMYSFQNNDRMHNLTLSYRSSEAYYWETDFAMILKSFRITNIR